jgi:hypothetical protein
MNYTNNTLTAAVAALSLVFSLLLSISCLTPPAQQQPQPNRAPIIQSLYGAKEWVPQSEGPFSCKASDPDSDNLTYTWTADNGTIKGNGPDVTWTSPSAMGKYNISVTVSDGKGNEAAASQAVRVLINADGSMSSDAPVVLKVPFPSKEIVSVSQRMRIWTAYPIECIVDSPDAKNLKYSWTSANGRFQAAKGLSLEGGTASRVIWIAPGAGGDYIVNVTVTDNSGNEAKGQVNFKVICCTTE